MRRTLAILASMLLCLAFPLFAQKGAGKQQAYWVFDHVENIPPQAVPSNVTIVGNHTTLDHEDTWYHEDEDTGQIVQKHARIHGDFSWTEPQKKVAFGQENSFVVSCQSSFTPHLTANDINVLNLYGNTHFPASISKMTVTAYPPGRGYSFRWIYSATSNGSPRFTSGPTAGQLETFLPDGSWELVVSLQIGNGYSKGRPMFIQQNYYYHYEGPDTKTIDVGDIAPPTDPGEFGHTDIPWELLLIPGGVLIGWLGLKRLRKKSDKPKEEGDEGNEEEELELEEGEDETPFSTFRMIFWKDFGDTLVVDDPPQTIGARIEEITPQGEIKDRPDMTQNIRFVAEEHCSVSELQFNGKYMTGKVAAQLNADGTCPEDARVLASFNAPRGRLLSHLVFKVEDVAEILVEPAISFAAGQGKTLFMEFLLVGAASSPENIDVQLNEQGYNHFQAELEQDSENPDLFRIQLTEFGDDKEVAGTIQPYDCRIEVTPRNGREKISAGFVINRIHLGLRVELQALKGFHVMPESSYNKDILPRPDYKGQRKPAESRIDMMLVVVDEEDENKIHAVRPDKDPEFTFEDVFDNSTLFMEKTEAIGDYLPTQGELYAYGDLFFRDWNGEAVPSPVEALQFKYQFRGCTEDGSFWGIFYPSAGVLVAPNRSHARVKVKMTWHGQVFTEELVVPLNSQPYRTVNVPPGGDFHNEEAKWENNAIQQLDTLTHLRWRMASSPELAELRPLFYKITVMIEGFDLQFGFDQGDYENIMSIAKDFADGKIGAYYAVRQGVGNGEDDEDLFIATIANMDRSIPVIITRICLAVATGGASELILTPVSALVEMKQYVDEGGDSVWGGFKQVSVKLIGWELGFFLGGKLLKWGGGKIAEWWARRSQQAAEMAKKTRKIGEGTKKFLDASKKNKNLAGRPRFNSATTGNKIKKAADTTKKVLNESKKMADEAIEAASKNPGSAVRNSKLMEKCAQAAREDGQKIVEEFKRVMNNPTATKEEMRRVTLALQGNKAAQEVLRESSSDLLRANFNAQIKELYKEVDELALKRLKERLKVEGHLLNEPKLRVFNGATGNAGENLRLGKTIGADRDVTYQFWDGTKWVDLPEHTMEQAYSESFNLIQYKFIPKDAAEGLKTLTKADQALVNGLESLESYGDDLGRIIDPSRNTEKLADPKRVSEAFVHKCKMWLERGKKVEQEAAQLMEHGLESEAIHVMGYGETLIKEGVRQDVKQFKRILVSRIEAASLKGSPEKYKGLMAKISVLERTVTPPPPGTTQLTLEQARIVLEKQFGTTIERVVEECGDAVVAVNESL